MPAVQNRGVYILGIANNFCLYVIERKPIGIAFRLRRYIAKI